MDGKILLIVDPQVDFINGSLPVPGACEAMNALGEYIAAHAGEYMSVLVTADRHPVGHCSFDRNGGEWPVHCVADSVGAAIWPPVMDALCGCHCPVIILHKGTDSAKEEYSIFSNRDAKDKIIRLVEESDVREIDVCGLAGDVCVASTLRDGLSALPMVEFGVIMRFTPSLDGGAALDHLITESGGRIRLR